jgi:hypothetical protein
MSTALAASVYSESMTMIECHPTEVAAAIDELHEVAEIVRTYGDLGRTPASGQPMGGSLPTQLYLLAAAVEAQMRSMLYTDQLCASRLFPSPEDPPRSVTLFDLTTAHTVVVGAVSTEICVAELSEAQRRLTAATRRLRTALKSAAMTPVYVNLDEAAEQLRVFVAAFA